MDRKRSAQGIPLPEPSLEGRVSVEKSLSLRRSIRDFTREALTLHETSQLLWAAQGVTHKHGYRTAPSAGALYPLEIYLLAGDVQDLETGLYKYRPRDHDLIPVLESDQRADLCAAALHQDMVKNAPAVFVVAAVFERVTAEYGERGRRYVHMEAGHAIQNISLQAAALELGSVVIGAFEDRQVQKLLHMQSEEKPLGLMAVGRPK